MNIEHFLTRYLKECDREFEVVNHYVNDEYKFTIRGFKALADYIITDLFENDVTTIEIPTLNTTITTIYDLIDLAIEVENSD